MLCHLAGWRRVLCESEGLRGHKRYGLRGWQIFDTRALARGPANILQEQWQRQLEDAGRRQGFEKLDKLCQDSHSTEKLLYSQVEDFTGDRHYDEAMKQFQSNVFILDMS